MSKPNKKPSEKEVRYRLTRNILTEAGRVNIYRELKMMAAADGKPVIVLVSQALREFVERRRNGQKVRY